MKNIAVFVSGGGSNLQVLIDAQRAGEFENEGQIALVISSNDHAYGLTRAKAAGIKTAVFSKTAFASLGERDRAILELLKAEKIDYIVLAGYLGMLCPPLISEYKNKIINIHPSLLPDFGGKGFFGRAVHEAVLNSGKRVTGATVHFVDEEYDTGKILLSGTVEVKEGDTPETLAERVLKVEHEILPKAVKILLKGENK